MEQLYQHTAHCTLTQNKHQWGSRCCDNTTSPLIIAAAGCKIQNLHRKSTNERYLKSIFSPTNMNVFYILSAQKTTYCTSTWLCVISPPCF
ncbi:hypothetical protein FKM82_014259 [Ascaphus truei]